LKKKSSKVEWSWFSELPQPCPRSVPGGAEQLSAGDCEKELLSISQRTKFLIRKLEATCRTTTKAIKS